MLLCYKIRIENISYEEIIKYNNPFQKNLGAFQIPRMVWKRTALHLTLYEYKLYLVQNIDTMDFGTLEFDFIVLLLTDSASFQLLKKSFIVEFFF